METEESLKRKAEEEEQPPEKQPKMSKAQAQQPKTPNTINDLPAGPLENILGFLNTKSLGRDSRINHFWHETSENLLKVRKFSAILRDVAGRKTNCGVAWNYLNQQKIQVNLPAEENRYEIGTDEEENLLQPSLLHDLAEWQPEANELEIYCKIFYKLIELGANPNAVCKLEHIEESELVNTTEESVLDRAMGNGNQHMVFLLLKLYPSNQLIVNEAELLDKVINNFVDHDKLSSGVMANDHKRIRDMYAKIFNTMMKCGFEPSFATIKKYWNQNIQIPTGQPSTFRDLNFLLFESYPGEENETMLKELQTSNATLQDENKSLKRKLEVTQQKLVALEQANKESGKEEEMTELPSAQL